MWVQDRERETPPHRIEYKRGCYMELHEHLRHIRKEAGIASNVQADGMGLTLPTLTAMERGERPHRLSVEARRYLSTLVKLDEQRRRTIFRQAEHLRRRGTRDGGKLRELRKAASFNFKELAEEAGLQPQAVRLRELAGNWSPDEVDTYLRALTSLIDKRSRAIQEAVAGVNFRTRPPAEEAEEPDLVLAN